MCTVHIVHLLSLHKQEKPDLIFCIHYATDGRAKIFQIFLRFFECLSFYSLFHVHVHARGPRRRLRLLVLIKINRASPRIKWQSTFPTVPTGEDTFSKGIISKFKPN